VLFYTGMESGKKFMLVGAVMCSGGVVISGLSRALLTSGRDLISGAGLGIAVVGIIVIIVAWRQNQL
jgi:hypothetical protein